MAAEMFFTGLCSILNPDGKNKKMGEPAVILVDTTEHGHHGHQDQHIAFLAFDSKEADVEGGGKWKPIKKTTFLYMDLAGVELVIQKNPPATPKVDSTYYDLVAHRDEYWPEMVGKFNEDYVPKKGKRPKKTAVKAWMRFGKGTISASRVSKVPWRFTTSTGKTIERRFAEEVVYRDFPHSKDAVVIELRDLESGKKPKLIRFTLKSRTKKTAHSTLALIVGNSLESDMRAAVKHEITRFVRYPYADHFEFLNRVASSAIDGPVPTVINPESDNAGGGGSGGACGPGSGDGKP